ncbi:MAG: hypothetical protein DMG65_04865 [Candidatus Angelobacter sp. Gp1-AA117]|nr:MAG: hypothetical protein DMG65_04865 [Candidatus Angelobacter sp. Gp1-AA117]
MFKRFIFFLLVTVSVIGFAQSSSRIPDNKELVSRARSFYVESHTFLMKREQLESSLLGHPEFKAWDLQITNRKDLADLLVRVRRIPFTAIFTYAVTDRETQTVVMSGEVHQIEGLVHASVAREIIDKMKKFRGAPPVQQQNTQTVPGDTKTSH